MPRGARPGERRGGRVKGVPNRTTVEKLEQARIAEQIAKEVGAQNGASSTAAKKILSSQKFAKDELAEVIPIIKGIVAHFQRQAMRATPEGGLEIVGDLGDFKEWLKLFIDTSFKLADFQSPKFRAIIADVPASVGNLAPGGPVKVARLGDAAAAARAYQRYIQAPRQLALLLPAKRSAG
jgi:hypothetical protein